MVVETASCSRYRADGKGLRNEGGEAVVRNRQSVLRSDSQQSRVERSVGVAGRDRPGWFTPRDRTSEAR